MEVLWSLLLVVVFLWFLCGYYNEDSIKDQVGFKNKVKTRFVLEKAKRIMIAVTLLTATASVLFQYFYYNKPIFSILRWELIILLIIPIAYIDFKEQIIPNKILLIGLRLALPIIAIEVLLNTEKVISILGSNLAGAMLGGGIFLISAVFSKGGVGAGDIKLYFVFGLLVGIIPIFNVLLYSLFISAVTGIVLLCFRKKKAKDLLPLAPFTLIGVILAVIFGL